VLPVNGVAIENAEEVASAKPAYGIITVPLIRLVVIQNAFKEKAASANTAFPSTLIVLAANGVVIGNAEAVASAKAA